MACSSLSSSSSTKLRYKYPLLRGLFLIAILLVSLLSGSCSATRTGNNMLLLVKKELETASSKQIYKLKAQKAVGLNGQVFNYFPKGRPVPPSGPSKRHNSSPKN